METFGAETILIRNPNVKKIESNHADRDVENYEYNYIIENNGSIEQLESTAKVFVDFVIREKISLPGNAYVIINSKTDKKTIVFECNKMLEG